MAVSLRWTGFAEIRPTAIQRYAEGDPSRDTSLLDEALAISSALGMRPLAAINGAGAVPAGGKVI